MAETKLSIKLLIDTCGKRVLFGEAGKDCVDFLFFILSLPVSTLIRLLGKQRMVGALPNLYESIEKMNESYFQQHMTKETLLHPTAPLPGVYSTPLLYLNKAPEAASTSKKTSIYICPNQYPCPRPCPSLFGQYTTSQLGCDYFSDDPGVSCPTCGSEMSRSMTYVAPPQIVQKQDCSNGGGFVKGVVTYMVMDDLTVKPMSAISSIALLTQFNINDVSALEEKVVNLGINEAITLLKASLVSKKVLTNVFLNGDI